MKYIPLLPLLSLLLITGCTPAPPPLAPVADNAACTVDADCVVYETEDSNPCCSSCNWKAITGENAQSKDEWKSQHCDAASAQECDKICKQPPKSLFESKCSEGICTLINK